VSENTYEYVGIGMEEVDWDSWRNFYIEGRTPKSAVDRALERDF
jgi:hypothetical protein